MIKLDESEFREKCIDMVIEYYNNLVEITDNYQIKETDVYIVWMCSILGNNKALLSTNVPDGMYYEITYDISSNTFYFDAYKKWNHQEYSL